MTEEQKRKLGSLQTAFIVLQAKMCQAKTTTERDSAIKAAIIRLVAEPDKEVQEALLLWQARRMGHTFQNNARATLTGSSEMTARSAHLLGDECPRWRPPVPRAVLGPMGRIP
jgi:hypothetical protein